MHSEAGLMFMQEKDVRQEKIQEQKIYLVRHARPELPHGGGVYYGRTDYPLSQEGIASAKTLGAAVSGLNFSHIYTSPLIRARQTAKLIAPGRTKDMHVSKDLQEISLGEWEGKTYDEVRDQWNEVYEQRGLSFAVTAPPGGECFADVQKRAVPAFEKILKACPNGDILIVAHGGVIWTIMCRYFCFDLNELFLYPMNYCGVHVVCRTDGMMLLLKYNWQPQIA